MDIGEWSASAIICILVVSLASMGLVKGMLRLFLSLVCLFGTVAAAYAGYFWGEVMLTNYWPDAPHHGKWLCSATASLAVFFILRSFSQFIANPVSSKSQTAAKTRCHPLGLLAGIAIAAVGLWFGMNQLIISGSRAEVDYWLAQDNSSPPHDLPLISKVKQSFTQSYFGKKIANVAPLHDPVDHTVVKLAAMRLTATKEFAQLATTPTIARTLLNPDVLLFFMNDQVVENIQHDRSRSLLASPSLANLITDDKLHAAIAEIDIEHELKLR